MAHAGTMPVPARSPLSREPEVQQHAADSSRPCTAGSVTEDRCQAVRGARTPKKTWALATKETPTSSECNRLKVGAMKVKDAMTRQLRIAAPDDTKRHAAA